MDRRTGSVSPAHAAERKKFRGRTPDLSGEDEPVNMARSNSTSPPPPPAPPPNTPVPAPRQSRPTARGGPPAPLPRSVFSQDPKLTPPRPPSLQPGRVDINMGNLSDTELVSGRGQERASHSPNRAVGTSPGSTSPNSGFHQEHFGQKTGHNAKTSSMEPIRRATTPAEASSRASSSSLAIPQSGQVSSVYAPSYSIATSYPQGANPSGHVIYGGIINFGSGAIQVGNAQQGGGVQSQQLLPHPQMMKPPPASNVVRICVGCYEDINLPNTQKVCCVNCTNWAGRYVHKANIVKQCEGRSCQSVSCAACRACRLIKNKAVTDTVKAALVLLLKKIGVDVT